ncbi:MAG: sigma-70 family RNA polymerase sigma factor, partial [Bacillota bacterium]|nr:sigma-70 family RNA polymerase sigma factor [Bacillota bacterium]
SFLTIIEDEKTRNLLEEIYVKYLRDMFNISYSILNNEFDAEDCVQDAVLRLGKYIDRIELMEETHLKNFLFIVVRDLSYNQYRKNKNHRKIEKKFEIDLSSEPSESIENLMIRLENIDEVYESLLTVKREYVEIITLKYSHGFRMNEIAKILCISESNAITRLNRALPMLG